MFWNKQKYEVDIKSGKATINTSGVIGLIQQLIVIPETRDTEYDFIMLDKEGDEIYFIQNNKGRLDDRQGVPVGKDGQEKLTLSIDNSSRNEKFKIIFKIKE